MTQSFIKHYVNLQFPISCSEKGCSYSAYNRKQFFTLIAAVKLEIYTPQLLDRGSF